MILTKKIQNKFFKNRTFQKKNDTLNQFLYHIYRELKINNSSCDLSSHTTTLSNNKSSSVDGNRESYESNESLFTAKNSDYSEMDTGDIYLKQANNEFEFDWECSSYLKLLDYDITPQIMFANKDSLEIGYDTRNLKSLDVVLTSFNQSDFINESLFSLFLHDLFCFVSSLNPFILHNRLTLYNIFYDSMNSKFYVTDLQNVILKTSTDDYMSDTSSRSSKSELLKEYTDIICIHRLLLSFIQKTSLTKLINRIFVSYIPVDYVKLISL